MMLYRRQREQTPGAIIAKRNNGKM
jgi:hypothetical protein